MNNASHLHQRASELAEGARGFQAAAQAPGSHAGAPDSLAALEEAFQALSAAWYQVAADASPGVVERRHAHRSEPLPRAGRDGLSREQEAQLTGTLHDVAAAFARCARACREARSTATPLIARGAAATRLSEQRAEDEVSWFHGREPDQRVA
jgi:hypothetical protein